MVNGLSGAGIRLYFQWFSRHSLEQSSVLSYQLGVKTSINPSSLQPFFRLVVFVGLIDNFDLDAAYCGIVHEK